MIAAPVCWYRVIALLVLVSGLVSCAGWNEGKAGVATRWVADWEAEDSMQQWQAQSFSGYTDYQRVTLDGRVVLRAVTSNSPSALYQPVTVNLVETPHLIWSWRVENIYENLNPATRAGDDYPARIYVVVRDLFNPLQGKALNYVWASHPTQQDYWVNPFTENSIMIPLRSSADERGKWVSETVNIKADFEKYFGLRVNNVTAVALMTDSDNAGGEATAYYGNISFE